jgi:hypothetical protein
MIIELAAISRLCMTAIGRRLGPKRAKDKKNRLYRGVLGGKCGSSHESCAARLTLCHEMRNRYVLRTSVKYPSAVERNADLVGGNQKKKKDRLASKNKIRH